MALAAGTRPGPLRESLRHRHWRHAPGVQSSRYAAGSQRCHQSPPAQPDRRTRTPRADREWFIAT